MSAKCSHIASDGTKCGAWSLKDGDLCWFHDPRFEGDRQRAGQKAQETLHSPKHEPAPTDDLLAMVDRMLKQLQEGHQTAVNMKLMKETLDLKRKIVSDQPPPDTRILVEYVNDWRSEGEPSLSASGPAGGPEASQEV